MSAADHLRTQAAGNTPVVLQSHAALALADLLDALHVAMANRWPGGRLDYFAEWRSLEAAINGGDEPFKEAMDAAFPRTGGTE